MKRLVAVITGALLAACSSKGEPALSLPQGTVLGAPFAPLDGAAYAPAQVQCLTGYTSVLALTFSSAGGICAAASQACALKGDATSVSVALVRVGPTARPAFGPGTYVVGAGIGVPDGEGNVELVRASITQTDASCARTPGTPAVTGSVTLTEVTRFVARGSVSLSFAGGGGLSGEFAVPVCAGSYDVCTPCSGVTPTCT